MLRFEDVVKDKETVELVQSSLFKKAGMHGTLEGYLHQDEEKHYLVDFWTATDLHGNDIDETPLGDLVSDDLYIPMIEIAIAQPELLEADIQIQF